MKVLFSVFCLLCAVSVSAQKITREQYIERYAPLAIADMEKYGIPASIKMAQGLLESDNGNSRLALIGNNHFGIKCKSTWKGEIINHDDDAPQECFRSYDSAEQSWEDHSKFLDESDRYNALFSLDPKDYKAWARGLKAAGYATNPKYPEMLIKLIEDNELWRLDAGQLPDSAAVETAATATRDPKPEPEPIRETEKPVRQHPNITPMGGTTVDPDNFTVKL